MVDIEVSCAVLDRTGTGIQVYTSESTPALTTADRYLVKNNGKDVSLCRDGSHANDSERRDTSDPGRPGRGAPRRIPVGSHGLQGMAHWPPNIYNNARSEIALTFSSVDGVKLFCACLS